jgi:hypothetical protein
VELAFCSPRPLDLPPRVSHLPLPNYFLASCSLAASALVCADRCGIWGHSLLRAPGRIWGKWSDRRGRGSARPHARPRASPAVWRHCEFPNSHSQHDRRCWWKRSNNHLILCKFSDTSFNSGYVGLPSLFKLNFACVCDLLAIELWFGSL